MHLSMIQHVSLCIAYSYELQKFFAQMCKKGGLHNFVNLQKENQIYFNKLVLGSVPELMESPLLCVLLWPC
jgi:hypothetical protein